MEFYQAINNRRTVRNLKTSPIPTDVLECIIAAGIQVPTHNHSGNGNLLFCVRRKKKKMPCRWQKPFMPLKVICCPATLVWAIRQRMPLF